MQAEQQTIKAHVAPLSPSTERVEDPKRERQLTPPSRAFSLRSGVVLRATPGSYDYTVSTDLGELTCVAAQTMGGIAGASETKLISEGSQVVIGVPPAAGIGVILAVLPTCFVGPGLDLTPKVPRQGFENAAMPADEDVITAIRNDPAVPVTGSAAERPYDVHAGSWAVIDPAFGSGVQVAGPQAELRGSDRAGLKVSAVDDSVRLDSESYRHVHAAGESQLFNDGGFISGILDFAVYQHERLGLAQFGAPLLKRLSAAVRALYTLKGWRAAWQFVKVGTRSRPRLRVFTGYLGSIFHAFVMAPKADGDVAAVTDTTPDQGLMSCHIGMDGRMTVKSVSGLSLQLYKRIPVPRRKHQPWDPAGANAASAKFTDPKFNKPFNFTAGTPRAMELRDAEAWRQGIAYAPFVSGDLKTDYTVPSPADMTPPDPAYDETAGRAGDFEPALDVISFVNLEPDGSIVLRGGQGEELCLRDGKLILSAPMGVYVTSGRDIVALAGHDAIVKSKNSVDILATDGDVRVKAENNLHMVAASVSRGNILLESLAQGDAAPAGKGSDFENRGIVCKAAGSRVLVTGQATQLKSTGTLGIASDTAVVATAPALTLASQSGIVLEAVGNNKDTATYLSVQQTGVECVAGSITLFTESGLNATRGTQVWAPQWTSGYRTKTIGEYEERVKRYYKHMAARHSDAVKSYPYTMKVLASVGFGYRSTAQLEFNEAPFIMYQPSWAYMLSKQPASGLGVWSDRRIGDEYPWPGKQAYERGGYVKLLAEKNWNYTNGVASLPKLWDNLSERSGGVSEPQPFHLYEIIKGDA